MNGQGVLFFFFWLPDPSSLLAGDVKVGGVGQRCGRGRGPPPWWCYVAGGEGAAAGEGAGGATRASAARRKATHRSSVRASESGGGASLRWTRWRARRSQRPGQTRRWPTDSALRSGGGGGGGGEAGSAAAASASRWGQTRRWTERLLVLGKRAPHSHSTLAGTGAGSLGWRWSTCRRREEALLSVASQ